MFSLLEKNMQKNLRIKFDELRKVLENIDYRPSYYHKRAIFCEGRKSINVSRNIIRYLTEEGDNILDPCFGSGTFIIAAAIENRIGLGVELDNYTFNAVRILIQKANISTIENFFKKIEKDCYNEIMELYSTICDCGEKVYFSRLYYDPETKEYYNPKKHRDIGENGENIKYVQECSCGRRRKKFSNFDEEKIEQINKINVDEFPKHELIPNPRINITPNSGNNFYDTNFTNRSKVALLMLQKAINKLPDSIEKEFLQFVLLNTLVLSRITQYGSSSNYLYQVVREKAQESNVWIQFKRKYDDMKKFKFQELQHIQQDINDDKKLKKGSIKILNKDCKSISLEDFELNNKVDMIYTDPPYTDQNPYLERHQLFRDWLIHFGYDSYILKQQDWENEIVVTDSPKRRDKHGNEQYFKDIKKFFGVSYKLLKDYGFMVIHLNLASRNWLEVYNMFKNIARSEGFEPIFRYDIKNNDPTIRKQAARANTTMMEIVLFFIKLTSKERFWYIGDRNIDRDLYFLIKNYLKENNDLTQIIDDVIMKCQEYLKSLNLHEEARDINKIRNIVNKYFIIDRGRVYIDDDMLLFEDHTKEAVLKRIIDITPVIIRELIEKNGKFVKGDLLMNLSYKLDNGNKQAIDSIINNRSVINQILNSLCCQKDDAYYPKKFSFKQNQNSIDIATLEGEKFEDVIVKLLLKEGYHDVFKSPRTGDRGVDIYAKKDNKSYMFQVKRWVHNVDGAVIQRLHSMKENNNFDYAECITTSDYTQQAILEAEECGIILTNGEEIIQRLNMAFPGEYYHSLIGIKTKEE